MFRNIFIIIFAVSLTLFSCSSDKKPAKDNKAKKEKAAKNNTQKAAKTKEIGGTKTNMKLPTGMGIYEAAKESIGLTDEQVSELNRIKAKRSASFKNASTKEEKTAINKDVTKAKKALLGNDVYKKLVAFEREWRKKAK